MRMQEEKTLLILDPNTIKLQKELRYKELEQRGIPDPERTRAVEAEFESQLLDGTPWPGPVTGLDFAGNNYPDLVFTSYQPPLVLSQENFAGPYPTSQVNPYPNNPTPDPNSAGIMSNTYGITQIPAPFSLNWNGLASRIDSQPPTSGIEGFNSEKAIPEWRYPVEQSQVYPDIVPDIILFPSGQFNEAITNDVKKKKKTLLQKLLPWIGIIGGITAVGKIIDNYMSNSPDDPEERNKYFTKNIPEIHAEFTLSSSHKGTDVCDDYAGKIFDLTDKDNRPILPTEGLGYSNLTHPNCQCIWKIRKIDTKLDSLNRKQQSEFSGIESHIAKAAKDHTLHTVKPDGSLSNRTRGTNPMKESIGKVNATWIEPGYLENAKSVAEDNGGRLYLIKAAEETITDHRSEGEKYLRKLAATELQKMTRTAIGHGIDLNHMGPEFRTSSVIIDGEWDPNMEEMQYLVIESDPEVIAAIDRGDIADVSINGGAPRREVIEPCDGNCSGDSCELCNVPVGVILAELDDIGFTWVVSRPFMWHGNMIPAATPGIKSTVIEIL